ncbi:MAG TPA: DnaJ domain-containing protein [Acidimicrobiia bacterium]|nr:DnaJ domain-containing protein [Acidimicrobiia bacterium]
MPTSVRASIDLYAVLGVDSGVSGDDIARAYRNRAKQLHPDTSDDPDAARKFHELVAAYGVLSNHRMRREYDQSRPDPDAGPRPGSATAARPGAGVVSKSEGAIGARWTRRRAWTALVAGVLVAVLGAGAAVLTWQLHAGDARRHNRFRPVTAVRVGTGDVAFTTADGRRVRTREPQQHGEGNGLGPTVGIRYDPADPQHVIVDANSVGRDITLAIVALKLIVGGVVFVGLGARRLRNDPERRVTTAAR